MWKTMAVIPVLSSNLPFAAVHVAFITTLHWWPSGFIAVSSKCIFRFYLPKKIKASNGRCKLLKTSFPRESCCWRNTQNGSRSRNLRGTGLDGRFIYAQVRNPAERKDYLKQFKLMEISTTTKELRSILKLSGDHYCLLSCAKWDCLRCCSKRPQSLKLCLKFKTRLHLLWSTEVHR